MAARRTLHRTHTETRPLVHINLNNTVNEGSPKPAHRINRGRRGGGSLSFSGARERRSPPILWCTLSQLYMWLRHTRDALTEAETPMPVICDDESGIAAFMWVDLDLYKVYLYY